MHGGGGIGVGWVNGIGNGYGIGYGIGNGYRERANADNQ